MASTLNYPIVYLSMLNAALTFCVSFLSLRYSAACHPTRSLRTAEPPTRVRLVCVEGELEHWRHSCSCVVDMEDQDEDKI